jgi:hypothetical protein
MHTRIFGKLDGQFTSSSQIYAGIARLRYSDDLAGDGP